MHSTRVSLFSWAASCKDISRENLKYFSIRVGLRYGFKLSISIGLKSFGQHNSLDLTFPFFIKKDEYSMTHTLQKE